MVHSQEWFIQQDSLADLFVDHWWLIALNGMRLPDSLFLPLVLYHYALTIISHP